MTAMGAPLKKGASKGWVEEMCWAGHCRLHPPSPAGARSTCHVAVMGPAMDSWSDSTEAWSMLACSSLTWVTMLHAFLQLCEVEHGADNINSTCFVHGLPVCTSGSFLKVRDFLGVCALGQNPASLRCLSLTNDQQSKWRQTCALARVLSWRVVLCSSNKFLNEHWAMLLDFRWLSAIRTSR